MASIAGIIDKRQFFGEPSGEPLRVMADSRLDYHKDLFRALGDKLARVKKDKTAGDKEVIDPAYPADEELIQRAYQVWGADCPGHLEGDFAFAVLDQASGSILCARDPLGCRPLFYYNDRDYFAFASSARALLNFPELQPVLDEQMLMTSYCSRLPSRDRSFYRDIKKLEPGQLMEIRADGVPVQHPFWELQPDEEVAGLGEEEVLPRFRKLLAEAVRERIKGQEKVGMELSGGLDSSAVTAFAKQAAGRGVELHAFSHAMEPKLKGRIYPFRDESEWSRKVAGHLDLDSLEMVDGQNATPVGELCRWHMSLTAQPLTQLFPLFSDTLLARAGKKQVGVLLSGFGGDEAVSLKLRERRKGIFSFLKRRSGSYHLDDLAVAEAYRSRVRESERKRKKSRSGMPADFHEQQRWRIGLRHMTDRMEQSSLLARSHGFEYAYPLLDTRVLRFVYSLDEGWFLRKGMNRYLLRGALEGLLSDELRLREDKFGAALPNIFVRMCMHRKGLEAFIRSSEDSNRHHYVDYATLEWQLKQLCRKSGVEGLDFGPRIFFSTLSLLMLQDMEKLGDLKTGIRT